MIEVNPFIFLPREKEFNSTTELSLFLYSGHRCSGGGWGLGGACTAMIFSSCQTQQSRLQSQWL